MLKRIAFSYILGFVLGYFGFSQNNPESFYDKGVKSFQNKNYKNAVENFTKALKIRPDYLSALYFRGSAYMAKKTYDKAVYDFLKVTELDPEYALAYYQLGKIIILKNHTQLL